MAWTSTFSLADRHSRVAGPPPETIGHRALARGLSDLAAMGGRPIAAFLSLGLPPELTRTAARKQSWSSSWIGRFYDGLLALADAHNTPLAGGALGGAPFAS